MLQYDLVELDNYLAFVEEPVAILSKDTRTRSKVIPIVKVKWRHCLVEEATWKMEA